MVRLLAVTIRLRCYCKGRFVDIHGIFLPWFLTPHKVHNPLWGFSLEENEEQATWGCWAQKSVVATPSPSGFLQTVSFTNVVLVCKSLYADFCVQNTAQKNGLLAKEDRGCWLPSSEMVANSGCLSLLLFLTMYGVSRFLASWTELFWL